MCTFKIIAVTDWGLYRKFHGDGSLGAYAEYLAGLACREKGGPRCLEEAASAREVESSHSQKPAPAREVESSHLQRPAAGREEGSKGVSSGKGIAGFMEKGLLWPDMIIIREKHLPKETYMELFTRLWEKCKNHKGEGRQAELVPHTHFLAARQTGGTCIHLPFPVFEEYCYGLPSPWCQKIEKIGVSVHSQKEAKKAEQLGASYLIAGHIFPTGCKKGVPARGLGFLEGICGSVAIPVYAIGGIHKENLSQIRGTGAAGACMMSEYMRGKTQCLPWQG